MSTTESATNTQKVSLGKSIVTTISLTPSAQAKLTELLAAEEKAMALRIGVKPGGCSGYSYEMYFDSERADDDIETTFGDVKVWVDAMSAEKLRGSTLEYKDGLTDAGFHITNPNASSTCGCGSSFN